MANTALKQGAIDSLVLHALAHLATGPVTVCKLQELLEPNITIPDLYNALSRLEKRGYVEDPRIADGMLCDEQWSITDAGRKVAPAENLTFADDLPADAGALHREPNPSAPPTALCCIDEDDLDNWWAEQDVEVKADAFLRFALDQTTSFIYTGERFREPAVRVPVIGTANCTAEFEERLRSRAAYAATVEAELDETANSVFAANGISPAVAIALDQADGVGALEAVQQ